MVDLIDRQALLEDIEAAVENSGMGAIVAGTLSRYVKRCPVIDAVEVVRCEKCKSWKRIRDNRGVCKHPTFTFEDDTIDPLTEPNDFCSYGEMREDDG